MCIALQQFGKETNVIIGKSIAGDPFIIRKFTSGFVEATLIWTLEMDIYVFVTVLFNCLGMNDFCSV